ncbi:MULTISPECIES: hypothetical protein [unclassified Sphingomonas]|uniref:hypothetical protein n=1 Tax=unclassified Sphingomonas TaxID=196159 RepID=UPI0018D2641A|nr:MULTISPECIES: hypothetical protein [unclassified Sphingomonas]
MIRSCLRFSTGSIPCAILRRTVNAASRASASDTDFNQPSPISRRICSPKCAGTIALSFPVHLEEKTIAIGIFSRLGQRPDLGRSELPHHSLLHFTPHFAPHFVWDGAELSETQQNEKPLISRIF